MNNLSHGKSKVRHCGIINENSFNFLFIKFRSTHHSDGRK